MHDWCSSHTVSEVARKSIDDAGFDVSRAGLGRKAAHRPGWRLSLGAHPCRVRWRKNFQGDAAEICCRSGENKSRRDRISASGPINLHQRIYEAISLRSRRRCPPNHWCRVINGHLIPPWTQFLQRNPSLSQLLCYFAIYHSWNNFKSVAPFSNVLVCIITMFTTVVCIYF